MITCQSMMLLLIVGTKLLLMFARILSISSVIEHELSTIHTISTWFDASCVYVEHAASGSVPLSGTNTSMTELPPVPPPPVDAASFPPVPPFPPEAPALLPPPPADSFAEQATSVATAPLITNRKAHTAERIRSSRGRKATTGQPF